MLKRNRFAEKAQLQLFDVAVPAPAPGTVGKINRAAVPVADSEQSVTLWLCIRFPELCLEALGSPQKIPAAIFRERNGLATVYVCNALAADVGITPGMSLYTAMALNAELDVRQHQEGVQSSLLQALANWALAYTPVVSIDGADALLLEVGGSLRLFEGFETLRRRLLKDLQSSGHIAVISSAPVAKAALWLARLGQEAHCNAMHDLQVVLGALPLACLGWPLTVQCTLLQMGVRTLADCMRLPRDGFARRVGPGYLRELDRGFGRCPELLQHYQPPEVFNDSIELDAESQILDQITPVLHELLARLAAFLTRRQAATQRLYLQLRHQGRPATCLEIEVREPCASIHHFIELLHLRLDREILPAPVIEVSLHAALLPCGEGHNVDFWGDAAANVCVNPAKRAVLQRSDVARLIERLRARVGPERVHGLCLVAEHRPEYAWCRTEPYSFVGGLNMLGKLITRVRPLWLFAEPRPLQIVQGAPVYQGKLFFVSDAERIESGWWDGRDVRRDYYRVADGRGKRLWVYQDCRSSGWYLHGLFA